ncbi:2-oxo acid dehydrogenase subunit E2 [bacterium]|nr:2-oxo acid dehydrogenase subunit E2 [bacterium]
MAIEILIPKLGMTMKDAKLASWKCHEGDRIEVGQEIMVLETAKVTYDIEALDAGLLHIVAQPGDILEVGEVAGLLALDSAELASLQSGSSGASEADAVPADTATDIAAEPSPAGAIQRPKSVRITPKARRLADQNRFDYRKVKGSAPGGRIIYRDIVAALAAPKEAAKTAPAAPSPGKTSDSGEFVNGIRVRKTIPLEGMRKVIAERMMQSLQCSAQLSSMSEVHMSEVIRFRKKLLEKAGETGVRVTYTDILVYVVARVLKKVPVVNASLIDGQIRIWDDINIGIAVAFDRGEYDSGLLVPVIRHADRKSISEIGKEIRELGEKVRTGEISADDLSGGTFTISNTGMFRKHWAVSTPIINQPESGILQTGPMVKRVEEIEGQFVSVPIMPFSMTFDHRLLDGVQMARFSETFIDLMQDVEMLMY